MLDDPRREIPRAPSRCARRRGRSARTRMRRLPRHLAADVGDAQAAFPVLDELAADGGDLGVDDRDRHDLGLAGPRVLCLEARDEDPHALVHLRRRQPDAVVLVHRLDHVVDELLDGRRDLIAARSSGLRLGAQHGVAHARDFQNRHAEELYLPRRTARPWPTTLPLLPALRRPARTRELLKSGEPERLVCDRCGFVFYLDPKVAVGTIIADADDRHRAGAARHRARLRQVGVPGRLRRSRRAAHGGGHPRSTRGMRPRRPARGLVEHLLLPGAHADHHRLRGDGWSAARWRWMTRASRPRRFDRRRTSRGTSWRSAAPHEALRDYLAGLLPPAAIRIGHAELAAP